MTVMQPTVKITVSFTGNSGQVRHKWTIFSDAAEMETAAREATAFILDDTADDPRGPEAWITAMEIERVR